MAVFESSSASTSRAKFTMSDSKDAPTDDLRSDYSDGEPANAAAQSCDKSKAALELSKVNGISGDDQCFPVMCAKSSTTSHDNDATVKEAENTASASESYMSTQSSIFWADIAAMSCPSPKLKAAIAEASVASQATPQKIDPPPLPSQFIRSYLSDGSSGVVKQNLVDLLGLSSRHRQSLLRDPSIHVRIDSVIVTDIYKRFAMAVSRTLNEHFTVNPESYEFEFLEDQISPDAVCMLFLLWAEATCSTYKAFSIPDTLDFRANIETLRAVRLLGMEPYAKPLLKMCVEYIQKEVPNYNEIEIIERNKTSEKDPLWTSLINHLHFLRTRLDKPDSEEFEKFLQSHPVLANGIEAATMYFENRDKERRRLSQQLSTSERNIHH